MNNSNHLNLIRKYRNREAKAIKYIVRKRGFPCKITLTALENKDSTPLVRNHDPFQKEISLISNQYAHNPLSDTTISSKIFLIKRSDPLYYESSFVDEESSNRGSSSLRNDYVAYLDSKTMIGVGCLIEIDGIENAKYIVHRAFRHREFSDVFRYELSREY